MALCLLCTAVAALTEAEAPSFEDMPLVKTLDDGVELTDADFEGDWIVDKVFLNQTYLTLAEVEERGLTINQIHIGDGKISRIVTDEDGEHESFVEYTLESNQILFTDGEGLESVIEKLEDGNIVVSVFLPGEGETPDCLSIFMVHPEA